MATSAEYLTVASILSGFGVTVLMFRLQRELFVREEHPDWMNWLAWADYLILAAILMSLLLVVVPLITSFGDPGIVRLRLAGGACGAAAILIAAYPFAILDHYRILTGRGRKDPRQSGEPIERAIVMIAAIVATAVFVHTIEPIWWT